MNSPSPSRKVDRILWQSLRVTTLLACLAIPVWRIYQAFAAESYTRFFVAVIMPIAAILLFAIWYLPFGWGALKTRAKRFGLFVLALIFVVTVSIFLFRYEGSIGGSSLPKLAFRWSPKPIELTPELTEIPAPNAAGVSPSSEVEGAIDSLEFYGPNRDATWRTNELKASFDWLVNPPEELWRREIGLGWSGFSVAGSRAVTQEQRGEGELTTCYDLLTGDLLWAHTDETGFYMVAAAEENNVKEMAGEGPRAVPTIHKGKVFGYGATGVLNCLELETGELNWSRNVLEDHKSALPKWGKSTSPLILENLGLVVVSIAENSPPTLAAFRMEDGEPVWTYMGTGASYGSPALIELHGVPQIVSVNGHDVTGHDPVTGDEWWSFSWPGSFPKVGQPIRVSESRLLVTAGYGAGSHLLEIGFENGAWSAKSIWRTQRLKTKFSSAVVRDGFAYGLNEGRLACVDLKDGGSAWKGGKYKFGQQLLVGDQLLVQAEDGYLAIVKASPEAFEETARIDALTSMTWNPPTLAGRYLLVRNHKEAICFRLPAREELRSDPVESPT